MGATAIRVVNTVELDISIHAPLRERHTTLKYLPARMDFNPRSLAGATRDAAAGRLYPSDFNPRSLAGATHALVDALESAIRFQSTLPCGSDHYLYH